VQSVRDAHPENHAPGRNGYYDLVSPLRFLAIILYMGYLVNVGLLLVLLPWSQAWGMLLTMFPTTYVTVLDQPFVRGLLSAFGVLHLLLVLWELVHPTLLTPTAAKEN